MQNQNPYIKPILEHLLTGQPINQKFALENFGCENLAECIQALKISPVIYIREGVSYSNNMAMTYYWIPQTSINTIKALMGKR